MQEEKKEVPQEHKDRMKTIDNHIQEIIKRINLLSPGKALDKKSRQRIINDLINERVRPLGNAMLDLYVHAHQLGQYFKVEPRLICATKSDSTGEHCPEKPVYKIMDNEYLCEKCHVNYLEINKDKANIGIENAI